MCDRYIIADPANGTGWTHIFLEDGEPVERMTRFVFDKDERVLLHVDVEFEHRWHEGGRSTKNELEDSLLQANGAALSDPEGWGLEVSDDLPSWAQPSDPGPDL